MRADVGAQQFVARVIPQHAHHRIVYVQKSSIGRGKEQAFLNAVEQFAISPLRFPPISNVFQDVNRARVVVRHSWRARGGHQKNSFRRGYDIFLPCLLRVAAKGARKIAPGFRDLPQTTHRFAHQSDRWHAQMRSQRPIRSHNAPRAIVHHDVVADGVDIFHPLALRAFQL